MFSLSLCSVTFSADAKIFMQNFKFFFFPQKVEKTTPKICILMAVGSFFFLCCPNCTKQPRTSFLFHKLFYPTISGRISDYTALTECICKAHNSNKDFFFLANRIYFMTINEKPLLRNGNSPITRPH